MISYKDFCAKIAGEQVEAEVRATPDQLPCISANDATATKANGESQMASRLGEVSNKALDKLNEIMELPLNPEAPQFGGLLRAQTAAAGVALTTQCKVDETTLRKQSIDRMPELLRLAAEVRKTLPPPGPINFEGDYNAPEK
jgi:hypothetical protein